MSITPVFVLGAFHSATTILYHMLSMHPDATWLSQFSQRDGRIPGRRKVPFYAQLDRVSRFLFDHDWEQTGGKGLKGLIVSKPQEAQNVWRYVFPLDGMVNVEPCADRMYRVLEEESRIWKARSHIIIKHPYLSRHVSLLGAVCPEAKFIHIVRDGRAVALSLQSKRLRTVVPPASALEKHQVLENVARYWTDVVGGIENERESIDLVEVRYEDFCTDVRGHLRRMLQHIGLSEETFPFGRCPSNLTPTNDRWIRFASPDRIESVERIQEPWLRSYGYL